MVSLTEKVERVLDSCETYGEYLVAARFCYLAQLEAIRRKDYDGSTRILTTLVNSLPPPIDIWVIENDKPVQL